MANRDTVEFRLFDSDLVTVLGILPAAQMDLFLQLNEPGSGKVKIPMQSRAAGLAASGGFAEGKYRGAARGGFFVENIDKENASSGENASRFMSISGRGALALLDDGIVWDDGTSATTRNLTGTKAGMLIALILEAKARGALSNLTYNFTAVLDSVGVAWTDDESLGWSVGTSLLDVARQIAKRGIDFDITPSGTGSFVLSAYKNGKGTNKSETVYFRVGVNCEEVSSLEAGGDIRNAVRISYKAGYTGVSDSASIALRRRREKLLDARNAQTSESALTYGSADLSIKKDPKKTISVKIYDGKGPRAFIDYALGDTVTLDIKGAEATYRVRGMQLSWDGKKFADVVVDLNSIIDENEIRLSQDVEWLLDEWETARDANLMATSFWAAIGNADDVITEINCMHAVGNTVYFGGQFTKVGGVNISGGVAVYNAAQKKWSTLAVGCPIIRVKSIVSYGTDLYVCGFAYEGVVKYDTLTGTWSSLGGGLTVTEFIVVCNSLLIVDDNLYVTGYFDGSYIGAVSSNIARWDITEGMWYPLGTGLTGGGGGGSGYAMAAIGSDLYVGGEITDAGGVAVSNIARWNGSAWSAVGAGLVGACLALAVLDTSLIAGGGFTGRISAWDGSAWAVVDGGLNGICRGLVVYLTDIYATGDFTQANGISANYIAKYNGGGWTALEKGLNNKGYAIALIDDDVYVCGIFSQAGGKNAIKTASYISTFESLANYLEKTGDEFDLGAAIHNAPASAITDADEIPFWEDVSNALRKITWANIKTTLQTLFDTLYLSTVATDATLTGDGTVANPLSAVGGGGGTPGGASGEIQYNNAGAFGGLSSFYYDPTLGIVYLGGAGGMSAELNSASLLNLLAKADDQQVLQTMWAWGATSTTVPTLAGYRARGTKASPTALQSGDRMMSLAAFGHDGVGYVGSLARILYKATENLSATNHGAGIYFEGTPNGSTTRAEFGKIVQTGFDVPTGFDYRVNGQPYYVPYLQQADTKDPTGWVNGSAIGVSYDATARTITLTGTLDYYWRGKKYSLTSPFTSSAHAATNGVWFLSSADGLTFTWSNTVWAFDAIMVAFVNYGASNKFAICETHGLMGWETHRELHNALGTYRSAGGTLSSYVLASTTAGNRRPAVSATTLEDEDNATTNAALTSDLYTQIYFAQDATTNVLTYAVDAAEIVPVLSANPYYNAWDGAKWNQTLMANNSYSSVWLIAVPVTDDAASQKYRYLWLEGQSNGTLASQQSLSPSSVNLGSLSSEAAEFVFLAQVIIRYTGGNWQITSVTNLLGNRFIQVGAAQGAFLSTVATDATLTGDGTLASPLSVVSSAADGWTAGAGTWSYSSADAPSFIIATSTDLTGSIGVGMRIKLTQTTVKYFIVTAITSSAITVYGGTDYTLANAAITSPYFSNAKSPLGFPMDEAKWSVIVSNSTNYVKTGMSAGAWHNAMNSGSLPTITAPIGMWKRDYFMYIYFSVADSAGNVFCTMSTANNTQSDSNMTNATGGTMATLTTYQGLLGAMRSDVILVATKTAYYMNIMSTSASEMGVLAASIAPTRLRLVCAYL